MPNIHGLYSNNNNSNHSNDDEDENRYVGGNDARGGGSGLAVQPNHEDVMSKAVSDADAAAKVTTRITMYRAGFQVNDGPYRRLDDPANADFLRALAMERVPAELIPEGANPGDLNVGLIDRRNEDYVETFSSFSGEGNALGGAGGGSVSDRGVIDVHSDYFSSGPEVVEGEPLVSIQVRLLNGKRVVVKLSKKNIVGDLCRAIHAAPAAQDVIGEPYVLISGFPPRVLEALEDSIADANLAGAVVTQKKA